MNLQIFKNWSKILSASMLCSRKKCRCHVKEVAKAGSDIATIPAKVFHEMYKHDLTDKGLKLFLDDLEKLLIKRLVNYI